MNRDFYFTTVLHEHISLPIYLTSIGLNFTETSIHRDKGFPDYQFILTTAGEGEFYYNNQVTTVCRNDLMVIRPHETHKYKATRKPWKTNWISFNGSCIESILDTLNLSKTTIFSLNDALRFNTKLNEIFNLGRNPSIHAIEDTSTLLYNLMMILKQELSNASNQNLNTAIGTGHPIDKIIQFIDVNYSETITLSQLSSLVNVSPQYLCKLFKDCLNTQPMAYLNQVRINKSKHLMLINLNIKQKEIAKMVGYDSPSYFGLQFKKLEGVTPSQFRTLHKR